MPRRSPFVEALKKCVKTRGLTYAALAPRIGLSEPSVKRLFSGGRFTLAQIERILRALDMELHEVARMSRGAAQGAAELTLAQEQALAADEKLMSVFWLLQNDWRFGEILEDFAISRAELTGAFARLERAGLIEWGPQERARLRVPRAFQWRAGGPVKRAYGQRVTAEFLRARFAAPLETLRFETREVSAESAAVMQRRLERLAAEFTELAEIDSTLPARKRIGVGLLVACRPWRFSIVNALKARRAAR